MSVANAPERASRSSFLAAVMGLKSAEGCMRKPVSEYLDSDGAFIPPDRNGAGGWTNPSYAYKPIDEITHLAGIGHISAQL